MFKTKQKKNICNISFKIDQSFSFGLCPSRVSPQTPPPSPLHQLTLCVLVKHFDAHCIVHTRSIQIKFDTFIHLTTTINLLFALPPGLLPVAFQTSASFHRRVCCPFISYFICKTSSTQQCTSSHANNNNKVTLDIRTYIFRLTQTHEEHANSTQKGPRPGD